MARSWGQLLGDSDAPAESEVEQRGFFGRLRESLGKSRRALTEQLAVAAFDPGDDASWERLEEALIYADVGVRATAELIRRLEARQDLSELGEALAEEIAALFGEPPTLDRALVVGGDEHRRGGRHRAARRRRERVPVADEGGRPERDVLVVQDEAVHLGAPRRAATPGPSPPRRSRDRRGTRRSSACGSCRHPHEDIVERYALAAVGERLEAGECARPARRGRAPARPRSTPARTRGGPSASRAGASSRRRARPDP